MGVFGRGFRPISLIGKDKFPPWSSMRHSPSRLIIQVSDLLLRRIVSLALLAALVALVAAHSGNPLQDLPSLAYSSHPLAPAETPGSRGWHGLVRDSRTGLPVSGATIFFGGQGVSSDREGRFRIEPKATQVPDAMAPPLLVKAPGYRRRAIPALASGTEITLDRFDARGIYLSHFGISSKLLRTNALNLIEESSANALVVDVKGDRGWLSSEYSIALAEAVGAHARPTIGNVRELLQQLHGRDIYVIARIVVFKDDLLAKGRPGWALIDAESQRPWIDKERLAWTDPFRKEVWEYNIDIAEEAAKAGFDEIQFDYVRFPTDGKIANVRYARPNTMANRVQAITGFLGAARERLLPYNVYLSADVFGYVAWNRDDTSIGQSLESVAESVDYLSLMIYPSSFHLGLPDLRNPVVHPGKVVLRTLEEAKSRLANNPRRLRPWLQNFRDYAFDRRPFGVHEIAQQIHACDKVGTSGWLLWDPRNYYQHTLAALKRTSPTFPGLSRRSPSTVNEPAKDIF